MGEVYKAEDTRLKRVVALKVLPGGVASAGEAGERFEREAQAAAALDHPNICTLYEIGAHDGDTFLTMAFVEGESLDRRIERSPLSLEVAAEIARQAAEGLAAAHAAGIVHRDIKPSNIMLGGDRAGKPVAKLLDFGLARLAGANDLTRVEARVGTTAYMSPEQALGEEVDSRTDIWSLGVVFSEMVTGERPFKGDYDQAILYSILNEAPEPVTALRSGVPMELEWIIDKCLAKRPDERYQDARELIVDIERLRLRTQAGKTTIRQTASALPEARPALGRRTLPRPPSWGRRVAMAALASGLLAGAFGTGWWLGWAGGVAPVVAKRLTLHPSGALEDRQSIVRAAIAPDGHKIAFSTSGPDGLVWIQPLDQFQPYRVEGTEGARNVFWSPDSSELGFSTGTAIAKAGLRGQAVTPLADVEPGASGDGAWCPESQFIVFPQRGGGIGRVSSLGGAPMPLVPALAERRGMVPSISCVSDGEGGDLLLYSLHTWDSDTILARRLSGGEAGPAVQVADGADPEYSPSGHLLFRPERMSSALWAAAFSLQDLEIRGEPFLVTQSASSVTLSADGSLVHLDNPYTGSMGLQWVDSEGTPIESFGKPQPWIVGPRVSPAGDRVLVTAGLGRDLDLWVHETTRPVVRRVTFDDDEETGAIWSPDGAGVLLGLRGSRELRLVSPGGGRGAEVLYSDPDGGVVTPLDWSRDGRYILVGRRLSRGGRSGRPDSAEPKAALGAAPGSRPGQGAIGYLTRAGGTGDWEYAELLPPRSFSVDDVSFSPDGRFIAYQSHESGGPEVYVATFPEGGRRWQVTDSGGRLPRWSPEGGMLYYLQDVSLFSVAFDAAGDSVLGEPRQHFSRDRFWNTRRFSAYDVGTNGRIALATTLGGSGSRDIRVTLNWPAAYGLP